MKSGIDWNELIPLLPKKMRDDIYLEAVAILSAEDDAGDVKKPKKVKDDGTRLWRALGIPGHLNKPGRKFRINKNSTRYIDMGSNFGRVWALLKDSKADTIISEGIESIAKGVGVQRGADAVWYLWARSFIDVEAA